MNNQITKKELYAFIKSMVGVEINDSTRFFEDVGIIGMDADQMMIQIAEKYNIDLNDYKSEKYHFDEAEMANVFLNIWRAIKGDSPKHRSFTASHLFDVINEGKWTDPKN